MAHSVGPSAVAVLRPPTCCSRGSRSIRPRAFAVTRHWTGNGSFRFPASGPWTLILPNARKDAGFPRGLQASASPRPQSPADDFYYPHGLKPLTPGVSTSRLIIGFSMLVESLFFAAFVPLKDGLGAITSRRRLRCGLAVLQPLFVSAPLRSGMVSMADSLSMAETAAAIEDFSVRPMDSPSRYLSPYSAFYQIRGRTPGMSLVFAAGLASREVTTVAIESPVSMGWRDAG